MNKIIILSTLIPILTYGASSEYSSHPEFDSATFSVGCGMLVRLNTAEAAEAFVEEWSLFKMDKAKYAERSKIKREIQHLLPLSLTMDELGHLPLTDRVMIGAHKRAADVAYKDEGGVDAALKRLYKKLRELER